MSIAELVVSIVGDMSKLSSVFTSAANDAGNFGSKMSSIGSSLSQSGRDISEGITVPIVAAGAGIAAVTSQAVDFENGMAKVYTLLPNASKESMGKMSEDVKNFSKEMGVTTDSVLPALYDAIGSGIPEENVFSFLEIAQKGAVAGATDIGVAVDTLTSITNAYGQENLKAADASDILFTGINVGKMSYEELKGSLYEVVPTAASLGVGLGDVTAALAAMTSQGTPTGVATAQLRQLLVELSKEGTGASDTFKEIAGKSFPQFIKEGGGLQEAINLLGDGFAKSSPQAQELQKKIYELADPTSGLAQEFEGLAGKSFKDFQKEGGTAQEALKMLGLNFDDANVRLSDCFGSIEAGNAVLNLTGQGSAIFSDALKEMENSAGATDEAYAKMSDTSQKSLDNIKAKLEVLMVTLGSQFLPILENTIVPLIENSIIPAIEKIMPVIAKIAEAFGKLSPTIQTIILAFIAFVAALGPILIIAGSVASAIGTLATLFGSGGALSAALIIAKTAIAGIVTALGSFALPIGLVIAAVVALALAWKNNWFDIRGKFQAAKSAVETAMKNFSNTLQQLWHGLVMAAGNLKTNMSTIWDTIKTVFSTVGNLIIGIVVSWTSKLANYYVMAYGAVLALKDKLGNAWNNIKTTISTATANIIATLQTWYTNIQNKFTQVKTATQQLISDWSTKWNNLKTTVSNAANQIISTLQTWYNNVQNKFSQAKAAIQQLISDWSAKWNTLKSTVSSAANQIVSTLQTWYNNVRTKFNAVVSAISDLVSRVKSGFSDMVTAIKNKATDIVSAIGEIPTKIKNKATEFYNAGRDVVQKLVDGLTSKLTDVKNKVSEITNAASISGSSMGKAVSESIKSSGKKAKVSLAESAKGLKRLLPHSPAEEGPFKELPNWDAIFLDPLNASINKVSRLSLPLSNALSNIRNPLDSSMATGLQSISNVNTSSSVTTGDTVINIGPVSLSNTVDLEMLVSKINQITADQRRQRGVFL